MDEIGTPFCITVDYDGLEDGTVTIRDSDTAEQKRIKLADIEDIARQLATGKKTLADLE
jgi:glycyl-tRNA synthetase